MSNINSTDKINNALVWTDRLCDYIPIASTITNLVDIFEKCAFSGCSSKSIKENRYITHIKDKKNLRCAILLVPILGNIIVAIYDVIQNQRARDKEKAQLEAKATWLGLDNTQLPQNINERRKIIEEKWQNYWKEELEKIIPVLEQRSDGLRKINAKFEKIINNPNESLEISIVGLRLFDHPGSHIEKINYFWSAIKFLFACQNVGNNFENIPGYSKYEKNIKQKQQEISELQKLLGNLRQKSYGDYIKNIGKDELLQEAKKYYIESFYESEQYEIKQKIETMDMKMLLPKLKERIQARLKFAEDAIEMKEIIFLVEHK